MANVRSCYLTPSAMTVQVQLLGLHLMHRALRSSPTVSTWNRIPDFTGGAQ